MAKRVTAYEDRKGVLHKTPEAATRSDLTFALGRVGEATELGEGLANSIITNRHEIERVLEEHDAMMAEGEPAAEDIAA